MSKRWQSRLQAIAVWWVVFFLGTVVVAQMFRLNMRILIPAVPASLAASVLFYFVSLKIFMKSSYNRFGKYDEEIKKNGRLSDSRCAELENELLRCKKPSEKNNCIFILTTHYVRCRNAERAKQLIEMYDTYEISRLGNVSDRLLQASWAALCLDCFIISGERDRADAVYNSCKALLDEFINEKDIGTKLRQTLASYFVPIDVNRAAQLLDNPPKDASEGEIMSLKSSKALLLAMCGKINEAEAIVSEIEPYFNSVHMEAAVAQLREGIDGIKKELEKKRSEAASDNK